MQMDCSAFLRNFYDAANVLVSAGGTVQIADFGAATRLHSLNQQPGPVGLAGTPWFMSTLVHQSYLLSLFL